MKADHFRAETLGKGSELTKLQGWKNSWTKRWTRRIFALNIAKECAEQILECLRSTHIMPSVFSLFTALIQSSFCL